MGKFKANFNKYYIDDGNIITTIPFSPISNKIIELCQEYNKWYEELFMSLNQGCRICKSVK
jgi:hypothetical protein